MSLDQAAVRAADAAEIIVGLDAEGGRYRIGKLEAHRRSTRHLAISVFVLDGDRLLLQQRADTKYHSGGLWANTCCSHPRWDESPADCASRRLREELAISLPLTEFAVVEYAAPVGALFENEVVHCFRGSADASLDLSRINPAEAKAVAWRTLDEIAADLQAHPERYSAWFRIYMARHRDRAEAFAIPS
jgi:isopentenyl-diphosphate delta-isomerase